LERADYPRSIANTMAKVRLLLFTHFIAISATILSGCGGSISSTGFSTSGCGAGLGATSPVSCPVRTPVEGVGFAGKVEAGTKPVSGAAVQLYAAGIAGNGSSPMALLSSPITTGAVGTFAFPGGYMCPSAQTPVYLISKGGQAGAGATNPSLWLMAALGPCGSIGAGGSFVLNEVTTAASAWALGAFLSSGGNVGASCTNVMGLANAFLTANSLVSASTGVSPGAGIPATLTVPVGKLNTLANALASCTTSSGGSGCSALFSAAASANGAPSNTLDAAMDIAHAPGNNVAAIYALAAGNAIFSPALSAAPPDWMLHNTISGGGMSLPASVSVAASGEVWVSNYFNTVSEFTPAGAAVFAAGISGSGINQSYGMALDVGGNVWIANEQTSANSGTGNMAVLNSSGQTLAAGLTGGGINFPIAAAADSNGNMWIADSGDSKVTLLSNSGAPVSGAGGWGGTSLQLPVALAVDASHNVWVANQAGELPVARISADGSETNTYDCDCNGASGIAIDQKGDVWLANYYGNSLSEVSGCGTLVLGGATGGGLDHPQGIAIDGAGTVWLANYLGGSITEANGAASAAPGTLVSPSSGFGSDAGMLQPYGLAIDASGNAWVTNSGNNTLIQFIGIAAPVKTPMAGPPQTP
jgi:hypothetical protein